MWWLILIYVVVIGILLVWAIHTYKNRFIPLVDRVQYKISHDENSRYYKILRKILQDDWTEVESYINDVESAKKYIIKDSKDMMEKMQTQDDINLKKQKDEVENEKLFTGVSIGHLMESDADEYV